MVTSSARGAVAHNWDLRPPWLAAGAWLLLLLASFLWQWSTAQRTMIELARTEARSNFNKDLAYRRWAAMHGGVYVPVTPDTPPNPYLEVPEREVTTTSGRQLTLMNPAYMTRQVFEIGREQYGYQGHITSLLPIRPANAADPWESAALRAFERGVAEVSSIERLEGKPFLRLMRPLVAEKSCLKCHARQGYREGEVRGGLSVAVPLEARYALLRATLIESGSVHGAMALVGLLGLAAWRRTSDREVTARRRSEEEIRRLNSALEERVRERTVELTAANRELDSFAYAVSHDLRAPLRAINGFSQALLEDSGESLGPEARDDIERILRGARKMDDLVEGLLTLSRGTRGDLRREDVDLSELAESILAELASEEPARRVAWQVEPGLRAWGDPRMLEAVLRNLLGNAWKFTALREQAEIRFFAERVDGALYFSVADNGAGFDPSFAGRLFRPFERLHRQDEFPGLGIGLATVLRIVHRHRGEVLAEGTPGEGATFRFSLGDRPGPSQLPSSE